MSAELLGWVAGALTTLSFIPQLIQVIKLKSAREISLTFNSMLLIGMIMWLIYGIVKGLGPVILWNATSVVLIGTLFYAKLRYGK